MNDDVALEIPRNLTDGYHPSMTSMDIGEKYQQTWVPELQMNVGQSISALRKSWRAYKIAGRNGEPRKDSRLQNKPHRG